MELMWLIYALGAALFYGIRGIGYHWTATKKMDLGLMLFSVFITGAVGSNLIAWMRDDVWTPGSYVGILMGLFSFIGNFSLVKGFAVGNASLIAIMSGLPSVVVVWLAYLFWGETLSAVQWFSFLLIVAGIVIIRYSKELVSGNLRGLQWGLIVILAFACNDTSAKWTAVLGGEVFPMLSLMFTTGTLLFGGSLLVNRIRRKTADPSGSASTASTLWAGLAIGLVNLIGTTAITFAMQTGITGLVSAVTALNIVIILLYTHFVVKDRIYLKEWCGIAVTLSGIAVLQIG